MRKVYGTPYFNEGWALYAERVMRERGFFTDPLHELQHLSATIFRAARIIVDTSLHLGEMDVDQAIAFMRDKAALPEAVAVAEVGRYCWWPTQASSYLTGLPRDPRDPAPLPRCPRVCRTSHPPTCRSTCCVPSTTPSRRRDRCRSAWQIERSWPRSPDVDRVPLILDVDTGIDDALALLYAAGSPEAELVAVTCLPGNAGLVDVARNTRAVLELVGRAEVEVAAGGEAPLRRPLEVTPETHGPRGIGYAELPEPEAALSGDPHRSSSSTRRAGGRAR